MRDVLLNYGPQADGWCYTGGEPTLHPEFGELLKIHEKYNTTGSIMTNGQYMPGVENVLKNKHCVRFVRVSLDGHNAEVNDKIRGEGSYEQTVIAIKEYIKNGLNVGLGITIHEDNIDSIEESLLLGQSLGVNSINLWPVQQWVDVGSSNNRTKSLQHGEDIAWDEFTRQKYQESKKLLTNQYKKFFPRGINMSEKFANNNLGKHWTCENYSDDPKFPVNIANRIVLLPDGLISACCDLYDVNYNSHKYPGSPFCDEPDSDILGDLNTQTIDEILAYKRKHFEKLSAKRVRDLDAGLLIGGRNDMCTNCAYYHYQPASSKVIPITVA